MHSFRWQISVQPFVVLALFGCEYGPDPGLGETASPVDVDVARAQAEALARGCNPGGGGGGADTVWAEEVIDGEQLSAGFVEVADVDADGVRDVVVGTLIEETIPNPMGPPQFRGAVHLYRRTTTDSTTWEETIPFGTDRGLGFINKPQVRDMNGDGFADIVMNTGFLTTGGGSQQYLEGPEFITATPITPETAASPYFYHMLEQVDLDGDGDLDAITTRTQFIPPIMGPPTINLATDWYRNDGAGTYQRFTVDTGHCGVIFELYDVDRDGDMDVVCPQFFGPPAAPSIVWMEQVAKPAAVNQWIGEWSVHTIDATTGFGFDVKFADIDSDGQDELIYANHNNQNNPMLSGMPSGIYAFEIPADPRSVTQWERSVIDEGYVVTAPDGGNPASQGAPGLIELGDLDDNGLLDIVTAGDGADGLFVIWQTEPGEFERQMIADGNMYGQSVIVDINGDGALEIVAVQHKYTIDGVLPPGNVRIFAPVFE